MDEESWHVRDSGIPSKELQASFEKEFTQPSGVSIGSEAKPPIRFWKDDVSLIQMVRDMCLFFKAYVNHLSLVLLTGVVAVLACALRGNAAI